MKSDLEDLHVSLHHETEKAVLVSLYGEKDKAVWLPKSQIEIEYDKPGFAIVTVPEWLLIDKGLV